MKAAMNRACRGITVLLLRSASAAVILMLFGCGPGKGSISVDSTPSGARIVLNGVPQGTTPAALDNLPHGQYVIELRKVGHDTVYKSIALLEGQKLDIKMELPVTKGLLLVDSEPRNVDVVINGVSQGNTPLLMTDLPLGNYKLEFNSPTHLPRTMEAVLADRKPVLVRADLTSNTAKLVMNSDPEGAEVLINGVVRGTTPVTLEDVVAGKTEVKVAKTGYNAYERLMDLEATRTYEITAELQALPSALNIITDPAGAEVSIDAEPSGITPCLVNAQDGAREIQIALMGYETVTTNMVLVPNVTERIELKLVKNSGTLVLDTEPAAVKVYINGRFYAITEPKGGIDTMSIPLSMLLKAGERHTIQLVREGYVAATFSLEPELDQIVTRHERLKRIFVRDTVITTKDEVIKCRLEYRLPNGNIYYERYEGVYETANADDIVEVQTIDIDDEINREARMLIEQNRRVVPQD
jgi:hypothetical protein